MKLICEKCKMITEHEFLRNPAKEGLIEMYFKCTKCKTESHSHYENEESIKMIAEIKNLEIKIKSMKGTHEIEQELKRFKQLKLKRNNIVRGIKENAV
jgi:hypothetical protein